MSGTARQIVVSAHGIWSAPVWGRDLKVAGVVLSRGKQLHRGDGAVTIPTQSVIHFYTAHKEYGKRAASEAVFAAQPNDAYTGLVDTVREVQARTLGPGDGHLSVHNYELGHLEGNDFLWNNHQTSRYPSDIDLLVLEKDRECHLSDVFEACREARGTHYPVYHCCHCRYVEPGHE